MGSFFGIWSVIAVFSAASTVMAQDFTPISTDVPQDTTSVVLPPGCPSTTNKIPNAMWTFVPSADGGTTTNVLTTPADLVTVNKGSSGELRFTWNPDSFGSSSTGHGVRIEFPADQLEGVTAQSSVGVQVLDGFTNLQSIDVGSSATFWATITTSSNSTTLDVKSRSSARAYVKAPGAMVNRAEASSSANLELEAANVKNLQSSSSGKLTLKGNIESGSVSASAQAVVDGDITGDVAVSSSGKLSVTGDIIGSIEAQASGTVVSANSCDNVSVVSSARCSVGNVDSVTVTVDEQGLTNTGGARCGSGAANVLAGSFFHTMMISVVGTVVGMLHVLA